jgi:hypothetical protein
MHTFPGIGIPRRAALAVAALAAAIALSGGWILAPGAAFAFGFQPGPDTLSLQAPASSVVGQDVGVVAAWSSSNGQFLQGHAITLAVNSAAVATVFSDGQGRAAFTIPGSRLNAPGTYKLTAASGGRFGGASASSSLTVIAAPVVPAPAQPPAPKAAPPSPKSTAISLSVPSGSQLGQDVTVTEAIADSSGSPLAGQHLALMLDGSQLNGDLSDAGGHVSYSISGKRFKQAGAYVVQANFSGSPGYASSTAQETLTVIPAAIQIQTLPALPGLKFSLGNVTASTGPDGVAAIPIPASGTYKLTADLNPDASVAPAVKASFVRWADGISTVDRTIVVDGPASYVIGLRVASQARIEYVDMEGRAVDPALVQSARFGAADGTEVDLSPQTGASQAWWTATTAAAPGNVMTATPVSYRALSVKVHGAEVLAPDQPAWMPGGGATWTIRLLVYGLTVRTQDALFGAPISGLVHLSLPDGSSIDAPVHADGTATFTELPAGRYNLSLDSAGPSQLGHMAISVSGSESETLRAVTFVDLLLAIALGLGMGLLGLLAIARVRRAIRRRPA